MKRKVFLSLIVGLFLAVPILGWVAAASAQSFQANDTVTVPVGETVDSTMFVGGQTIDIAGTVNGDVFCGGQSVSISGTVNGDVLCGGQTVNISGKVNGDIRVGGQTVTLSGEVQRNATIAGQSITTTAESKVGRDLSVGGQTVTLNGDVGRDLAVGSENVTLNGEVGRDVVGEVQALTVGENARVAGDVTYTSPEDLTRATGAVIDGTVTRNEPKDTKNVDGGDGALAGLVFFSGFALYLFAAMLLVSFVLALVIPRRLQSASDTAIKAWPKTLLIGFLAHIIVPVAVIALLVSLVGIPLAVLVTLLWWVVLFVSGAFAAYLAGRLILHKSTGNPIWYMLLGSVVVMLLYTLPIINLLTLLAVSLFGVGMVVQEFRPAKPEYKFSQKLPARTKK